LAARTEVVDALVHMAVPAARAVGVTKYLMEAGVIPRSTRGRHGPGRVHYGPAEMADVVLACGAPLYSQASQTVARFAGHVAEPTSVLAGIGLRGWLIGTIRSFAAMTSRQQAGALEDNGLLELQVDPYDPNPFTAEGRIEWGPVARRQEVTFRWPEPHRQLWQVLREQEPACSAIFRFRANFRMLLALAKLLPNESAETSPKVPALPTQPTDETQPDDLQGVRDL
jgi:hypothetical protein